MHPSTAAGFWGTAGRASGLYMLAKLWPEHRDFSEVVSLLPSDLPQELICNVGATTPVLPADIVTKFAVFAMILSEKLPPYAE